MLNLFKLPIKVQPNQPGTAEFSLNSQRSDEEEEEEDVDIDIEDSDASSGIKLEGLS